MVACRGLDGTIACYPAAENAHRENILDISLVPARVGAKAGRGGPAKPPRPWAASWKSSAPTAWSCSSWTRPQGRARASW